jgi:AcrR family transcriptional regulator
VNAVLDSAGVGKRLLYEYFGDLEGLAAAWARDRPDPLALADRGEALRRRLEKVGPAERIGLITQDYASSLRDHPWASQVMLAELQRSNGIAKAMSEIRREIGAGHEGLLVNEDTRSDQALMEMAFILHAAANYLVLRARFAPDYNGVSLDTSEGWEGAMRMLGLHRFAGREGRHQDAPSGGGRSTPGPAARNKVKSRGFGFAVRRSGYSRSARSRYSRGRSPIDLSFAPAACRFSQPFLNRAGAEVLARPHAVGVGRTDDRKVFGQDDQLRALGNRILNQPASRRQIFGDPRAGHHLDSRHAAILLAHYPPPSTGTVAAGTTVCPTFSNFGSVQVPVT